MSAQLHLSAPASVAAPAIPDLTAITKNHPNKNTFLQNEPRFSLFSALFPLPNPPKSPVQAPSATPKPNLLYTSFPAASHNTQTRAQEVWLCQPRTLLSKTDVSSRPRAAITG